MDAHSLITLILEEENIIAKVAEDTVNGFFVGVHPLAIYVKEKEKEKEEEYKRQEEQEEHV